jgi:hypothetical protein
MPELDDKDKAILSELLRATIAADRFFMSPWVKSLQAILDKLDPPAARSKPLPPKPPGSRAWRWGKKRRR